MDNSPLVSVVTISLNAEKHIEQTIRSVISQVYKNIEYIIVDGKSTDNTLNIIEKYRGHITRFVSEKDNGIADAMNKGSAMASGDFVIFLHADDYFASEHSLKNAVKYLKNDNGLATCDILACDILYGKRLTRLTPRGFNFWMYFKTGIYHQGALSSRQLLLNMGGFDTRFRIAMDYDFFLRAYNSHAKIKYAPLILSVMRDTGIGSRTDWRGLTERFIEEFKVHKKNRSIPIIGYWFYWLCYAPYRVVRYLFTSAVKKLRGLERV